MVLNKRDLVPEWGTEVKFLLLRYRKASSKRIFFSQAIPSGDGEEVSSSAFALRVVATSAGYQKSERDPSKYVISFLVQRRWSPMVILLANSFTIRYREATSACYGAKRTRNWNAECR